MSAKERVGSLCHRKNIGFLLPFHGNSFHFPSTSKSSDGPDNQLKQSINCHGIQKFSGLSQVSISA